MLNTTPQNKNVDENYLYTSDDINNILKAYEITLAEYASAWQTAPKQGEGYAYFSLPTITFELIKNDTNVIAKALFLWLMKQCEDKTIDNISKNLRFTIPIHIGSEKSGHFVLLTIESEFDTTKVNAVKTAYDIFRQIKPEEIEKNINKSMEILENSFSNTCIHFYNTTKSDYLTPHREEVNTVLKAAYLSMLDDEHKQEVLFQQTDGTSCGAILAEQAKQFLLNENLYQFSNNNDDEEERKNTIKEIRQKHFEKISISGKTATNTLQPQQKNVKGFQAENTRRMSLDDFVTKHGYTILKGEGTQIQTKIGDADGQLLFSYDKELNITRSETSSEAAFTAMAEYWLAQGVKSVKIAEAANQKAYDSLKQICIAKGLTVIDNPSAIKSKPKVSTPLENMDLEHLKGMMPSRGG